MIQSVQVSFNPSIFGMFTAELSNNSAGVLCVNVKAEQLIDYAKASMIVIVEGRAKELDPDREIYKGTINICNLANGSKGNFFSRIISEGLRNFSNYVVSCPQPKNTYTVSNFPLDVDPYVPSFLPNLVRYLDVTVSTRGKITNNKPLIALFSFKFSGIIV